MNKFRYLILSLLIFSGNAVLNADEPKEIPPPQTLFIAPSIDQIFDIYLKEWVSPKNAYNVGHVHQIESGNSQSDSEKPIQNMFSGDHGYMSLREGTFVLGGINMEWSINSTEKQTLYFYADDYDLRVRGHFIPGNKNEMNHPCPSSSEYSAYINPFFPVNISGQHNTAPDFNLNYEGISLRYDNGKLEMKDSNYRSVIKLGTQNSKCYSGPMFVTDGEGVIVALDFKNVFTDTRTSEGNFIEFEYWVYYDPDRFQNLEQDIDHQIANSPIYCNPKNAHKHSSAHWSGSISDMIKKEVTGGYSNECLGIAFEFFPPENAKTVNVLDILNYGPNRDNTSIKIGIGSDDWIVMDFEPLKCGNEMYDSGRITRNNQEYMFRNERSDVNFNPIMTYPYRLASSMEGEYEMLWRAGGLRKSPSNNEWVYCFLRDYLHNDFGSDPWQRLIDPNLDGSFYSLYENEFIPNGSDISPMSLNWKYSSLAVMGRNGNKTPNISAGCDKADAACSFSNLISNLPNKFGNKIRKERNNTLRHIIYVDGKEDSFPIENAARKAWFYTNTHKVKINFRMDAQPEFNLPKQEREKKWDAILNSMTIIPVQPESGFMSEKINFKSSYQDGNFTGTLYNSGFFYKEENYEWIKKILENKDNSVIPDVLEDIIETPLIDKPFELADRATSLFGGGKDEIDTSLFDESQKAVIDRENELKEIEAERKRLEEENQNQLDDIEYQREIQRLELESMRAQLELERERIELERERQNLEGRNNSQIDNKEYYSDEDRGFFSKPKIGSEKTGGGFEDIASDPTKLAMLGVLVTLGTTLLQLFRGN